MTIIRLTGLVLLSGLGLVSCLGSGGEVTSQGDLDGGSAGSNQTDGKGIGEACSSNSPCRTGLTCSSGVCAAGHASAEGSPCTISAECKDGLYCTPESVCKPGGTKGVGEGCASDVDCVSGSRCGIQGMSLSCQPEGKGDLGAKCTVNGDCYGGLYCQAGKCYKLAPGASPFGVTDWTGENCKDNSTAGVVAYFRVPRGNSEDGDFYRLPFPNDIRTKDGHPDLTGHPTPGSSLLGYDPVDRILRATEKDTIGFSNTPTVLLRFSGSVDWETLKPDGRVTWIDITEGPSLGNPLPWNWGADPSRTKYVCENWFSIRLPSGSTLESGHTYAMMLGLGVMSGTGQAASQVKRSPDFDVMMSDTPPTSSFLTSAYAKYAPLRSYLKAKSIGSDQLLSAAVFTVGPVQIPMENTAKAVEAAPAPTASNWVKCAAGVSSPCSQADGNRACGQQQADFDELHALVSLPIYQEGTAPYLTPEDGGAISFDSNGSPKLVRTEKVCMSLTVPKGATQPVGGWPLVVYAHGTGGSFRSQVTEGVSASLASADAGAAGKAAFAVLGFDQVSHGPRRGASTASPNDLFFNFANPMAAKYNPIQGAADVLSIAKFAANLALDAGSSPTGAEIRIDPKLVMFWGHSQGATEGALGVPYSASIKSVLLSGNGASLMDSLQTKTSPVNIAGALPIVLGDVNKSFQLAGGASNPVLGLMQLWIGSSDPVSYAHLMAAQPPAQITAHHIFQPYGQKDTYSPGLTQSIYIASASMGMVAADSSVVTPDDILGLTVTKDNRGNLNINGAAVTALTRQYAPSKDDGHFVAFRNASAVADIRRFFVTSVVGTEAPQVGP